MKKRSPSSGQDSQLVHWWMLVHSGRIQWTERSIGALVAAGSL